MQISPVHVTYLTSNAIYVKIFVVDLISLFLWLASIHEKIFTKRNVTNENFSHEFFL